MSEDRYPPWRRTPQVCSELTIQITGLYRFKRGESTTLIVCKCSLGSAKSFTLCIPPEKLPLPISILFVSLRGQVPPRGSLYASLRRGLGYHGGGVLSGKRAPGLKGHRTGTNNHVTLVCTKIQRSSHRPSARESINDQLFWVRSRPSADYYNSPPGELPLWGSEKTKISHRLLLQKATAAKTQTRPRSGGWLPFHTPSIQRRQRA